MKYNICGFDQRVLCKLAEKHKDDRQQLDCTDLVILKWIAEFSVRSSVTKVIIEGNQYAWIVYNTIVDDLPFISINKRAFADRFDKLHSYGLIDKRVEKRSGMGTFLYVRVLPLYEELLYDNQKRDNRECKQDMGAVAQGAWGLSFDQQPDAVQTTGKDNTTIHKNYKQDIASIIIDAETPESVKEIPQKRGKDGEPKVYSLQYRCQSYFLQEYEKYKGVPYRFNKVDAANLKGIIDGLKCMQKQEQQPCDDDSIEVAFQIFINSLICIKPDKWIDAHFSIPNINSKFNEIYAQLKNGTSRQQNNGSDPNCRISRDFIERTMREAGLM